VNNLLSSNFLEFAKSQAGWGCGQAYPNQGRSLLLNEACINFLQVLLYRHAGQIGILCPNLIAGERPEPVCVPAGYSDYSWNVLCTFTPPQFHSLADCGVGPGSAIRDRNVRASHRNWLLAAEQGFERRCMVP
jgi:hypothetical protein